MSDREDPMSMMIIPPRWMLDEMRNVADSQGTEVVEYVRRCVAVDRNLTNAGPGEIFTLASGARVQVLAPDD